MRLNRRLFFDFEKLVAQPGFACIPENSPIRTLVNIFIAGVYQDYHAFIQEHSDDMTSLGLGNSDMSRKIRLLSLVTLSTNSSTAIPFSEIASKLEVDIESVETWIIDCIQAGLISGRMNQLEQTVAITQVKYRQFEREQWVELFERLSSWKQNLAGTLKVISETKKQIAAE